MKTGKQLIESARIYAKQIHKHQSYSVHRYEVHLQHVADTVLEQGSQIFTYDELSLCIASAWLHDAVSDASVTYNDIKDKTNEKVAQISVNLCEDVFGRNRKERNSIAYYNRINSNNYSVFVKLCDRIANVEYSKQSSEGMFAIYKKENDDFLNSLYICNEYRLVVEHLKNLFN